MKPDNQTESKTKWNDMMLKRVSHIAIAVKDLEDVQKKYSKALGLVVNSVEDVPEQKVRVAMMPIGDTRIELLQGIEPGKTVAKFVETRGEGFHHIAFEVDDIEKAIKRMKDAGLDMIDEKPRIGAGGAKIAFVHPKSLNGVLVELVEHEK